MSNRIDRQFGLSIIMNALVIILIIFFLLFAEPYPEPICPVPRVIPTTCERVTREFPSQEGYKLFTVICLEDEPLWPRYEEEEGE